MALIVPVFAVYMNAGWAEMRWKSEYLYVDTHLENYTQWSRHGTSPYLHDDDTTNYISTPAPTIWTKYEGYFTYENTELQWNEQGITRLWFKAKCFDPDDCDGFDVLYNGDIIGSVVPTSTSYQWYDCGAKLWLHSYEINAFKILLKYSSTVKKSGGEGKELAGTSNIQVTCSRLETWGFIDDYDYLKQMSGWAHMHYVNMDGDFDFAYDSYWMGLGIWSNTFNELVEVGMYVKYYAWGLDPSVVQDFGVFMTILDGGWPPTQIETHSLGASNLGIWCKLSVSWVSDKHWHGTCMFENYTSFTIDEYTYTNNWWGKRSQLSFESNDFQPRSGQSGNEMGMWYDTKICDDQWQWYTWHYYQNQNNGFHVKTDAWFNGEWTPGVLRGKIDYNQ
ncbi:MAG: hypothetical protein QXM22_02935 [Candidatus Bathyarchaeia archaeon]